MVSRLTRNLSWRLIQKGARSLPELFKLSLNRLSEVRPMETGGVQGRIEAFQDPAGVLQDAGKAVFTVPRAKLQPVVFALRISCREGCYEVLLKSVPSSRGAAMLSSLVVAPAAARL